MANKPKIVAVIPARMRSSRFPGKPLAALCGKPMILWVCDAATRATQITEVIVATDNDEIMQVCKRHGFRAVMTKLTHATGTDRIAEVAGQIDADIYINVQGDEPLLEPETIDITIRTIVEATAFDVVNLCARITDSADLDDVTVPKVVLGEGGRALFFSRLPIPCRKSKADVPFYRQVCVYAFRKRALLQFAHLPQGVSEIAEEIEILRFLEHNIPVKMIEVTTRSFGIDTPSDLAKATQIMKGGHE